MTTLQLDTDRERLHEQARLLRAARRDGIVICSRQVPAQPESGDLVRTVALGDHRWLVAVGDVMGHGREAARLAGRIGDHIELRARRVSNLGDLASSANDLVFDLTDGDRFASLLLLLLDGRNGTFRIANAGQVEPLAVGRGGGVVALGGHGAALGVLREARYRESGPVRMARGMVMAAVTDGVTDALDAEGRIYGRERLASALAREREHGPRAVVRRVLREVSSHAATGDDRTVLAVQFN